MGHVQPAEGQQTDQAKADEGCGGGGGPAGEPGDGGGGLAPPPPGNVSAQKAPIVMSMAFCSWMGGGPRVAA